MTNNNSTTAFTNGSSHREDTNTSRYSDVNTDNNTGTNNTNNINSNITNNNTGTDDKVTTAPITTSQPETNSTAGNNRGNSIGNSNGRAACRKCNIKYPRWAVKRKIEGRIEVAVDTDPKGNVTNVRLLSSSGNSKLDREHMKQAQNWKLKPNSNGRQGVRISTEYALEGSRRYREIQQRKKLKSTVRRQKKITTNSNNSINKTNRNKQGIVRNSSRDITNINRKVTSPPKGRRINHRRLGEALGRKRKRATNRSPSPHKNNKSSHIFAEKVDNNDKS